MLYAYFKYSWSLIRSRLSNISQPLTVCFFIISNSSFVNLPGLFKTLSGIAILPMSCIAEASAMTSILWSFKSYSGQFRFTSLSRAFVRSLIRRICWPVSTLLYSIIEERPSTSTSLVSFSFLACSATRLSRLCL